jgi:alpha/beta superfamily hydrolase
LGAGGLVLLSHSMGSWMSNVYLQDTAKMPFAAWVCLSITGRIGSTGEHRLPILDVQGENDIEPVRKGSWLRAIKVAGHAGSKRAEIAGANHFYDKQETQLLKEIDGFVKGLAKK